MKRLLLVVGGAILLWLPASSVLAAAAPTLNVGSNLSAATCGGTLIVNVTEKIRNDADSGVGGNNWALDNITRQIKVYKTAPGTFCATIRDRGTFTTFAGVSPNATGTVSAGVVGNFHGGYRATFSGTFTPSMATHGNIGTFDYGCTVSGICPGYVNWKTFYFGATATESVLPWWGWIYHTANNGTWVNAISGNFGDITGAVVGHGDGQQDEQDQGDNQSD